MGSKLVVGLVSQLGRIVTNPTGVSPSTSRPVEQFDPSPTKTFQAMEQRSKLRTAFSGVTEFSKPLEQKGIISHPADGGPQIGQFVEQILLDSDLLAPNYEGPIEQIVRQATIRPQQFILRTGLETNTSRPLQQEPKKTNSVQATQYDFIDLITPPCNSIKNPVNTDIRWRINDFGFPFVADSLIFKVEGVEVQDSTDFTITTIPNGLELFYDPPQDFPYNHQVQITVQISDTANPPNTFFYNCNWLTTPDTKAPTFSNISPACGSSAVSVDAPISFDVIDVGEGVDPDSITISVEGITVCSGITLEGITTIASGTGYHVTYSHADSPFNFDSEVTVAFQASDLSDTRNSSLFVCAFNTESSNSPVFINADPGPCETFVDNHTGLVFEVYGVEHGVDVSTLEVRVDTSLRRVVVQPKLYRAQ